MDVNVTIQGQTCDKGPRPFPFPPGLDPPVHKPIKIALTRLFLPYAIAEMRRQFIDDPHDIPGAFDEFPRSPLPTRILAHRPASLAWANLTPGLLAIEHVKLEYPLSLIR